MWFWAALRGCGSYFSRESICGASGKAISRQAVGYSHHGAPVLPNPFRKFRMAF